MQYGVESDPFLANFRGVLALRNGANHAVDLDASLILERNRMPAIRVAEKVHLGAGQSKSVELPVPHDDATTRFGLHVRVTSADGTGTVYDRDVSWPKGNLYRYVAGVQKEMDPLAFRFAYYPYRNCMRILAEHRMGWERMLCCEI